MPNIFAVKNGNWNDPTVWNTGVLPTTIDDVYANNFTVTFTNNVQVLSLRNTSASGINAGGTFRLNNIYNITADVYAGIVSCITTTATITTVSTINFSGNFYGGSVFNSFAVSITNWQNITFVITGNSFGGTAQSTSAILLNVTGSIINYTGNLRAGSGIQSHGLMLLGASWIGTVTGNCEGGAGGSSLPANHSAGLNLNAVSSNVTIIGNCVGGANGNFGACLHILSTSSILTINGICTGGAIAGAVGAFNNSISTLRVLSAVGSAFSEGVGGISTGVTTVQQITAFLNGSYGIGANIRMLRSSINQITMIDELGGTITMSNPTNIANQLPSPNNVRQGVGYAAGNLVGTLAVPSPNNVSIGVATDSTVGTAMLTTANIVSAVQTALPRFVNAATVESTGVQLAALL